MPMGKTHKALVLTGAKASVQLFCSRSTEPSPSSPAHDTNSDSYQKTWGVHIYSFPIQWQDVWRQWRRKDLNAELPITCLVASYQWLFMESTRPDNLRRVRCERANKSPWLQRTLLWLAVISYTSATHQGAIPRIWLRFLGAVMSLIFIHTLIGMATPICPSF